MFSRFKQHSDQHHLQPASAMLSVFTANDIRNLSVIKIKTPLSFNTLGHPLKGGLYDPALGPVSLNSDPCGTCGNTIAKCPGHFGHIELPLPVINPLFHKSLCTLLKLSCLNCCTFQIPSHSKLILSAKLCLLEEGQLSDLDGLDEQVRPVLSEKEKDKEGQTEYIRTVIDNYMNNLVNRTRFTGAATYKDHSINIKNVNIQQRMHVERMLKDHTAGRICINCHEVIPKVSTVQNRIMTTKMKDSARKDPVSSGVVHGLETVMIMPKDSKDYMRQLWKNEKEFLKVIIPCLDLLDIEHPTDIFFFEIIPVLPPTARPVNVVRGHMVEHPQTHLYKYIMQDCLILRNVIQTIQDGGTDRLPQEGRIVFEQMKGTTAVEKLHNAWQDLQVNVNHLMDRDMNKTFKSTHCQGLKQIIEKKEGIIRMHMMGKRVNFAARSVITPDPYLDIDEIGIPEAFALKLTYPVPVTPWNVMKLRELVLNGPNVYPGAVMVENQDGFVQAISGVDATRRMAIANRLLTPSENQKVDKYFNGTKILHRHLQNGDVLLLNRQPTLHKPSIMAHRARILKGERTLRLHYVNCKAYNADFDGDEMNAHFPQNEVARSEAYNLANVSNQYLVPKDGSPLSGLIQDHVVSGVRLTTRGKFFKRSDYMQLVYVALSTNQGIDVKLLPPAIVKPMPLWSGKQVLSTVVINIIPSGQARINLTSSAKIGVKEWQAEPSRHWRCGTMFDDPRTMSEAEVIIRHGELLCGVLDKTHCGATPYGLIHCIYELYGATCTSKTLSAFGKLFQAYLQFEGFTLSIEDILITPEANKKRQEIIADCRGCGDDIQRSLVNATQDTPMSEVRAMMEELYLKNNKFRVQVDRRYKDALDTYTNNINKICLPSGLKTRFPRNNLQLMVQSGAKGSTVNTMQISCLLGQIELEGKRPPLMICGKSLPCFPAYDPTPRAGGFVDGRFMTGIRPQEFFFHCMAGREGLIDTAVKTSRSGYLQRCLIKHLEGLTINYDSTVRDSDGSLIQFYYGEDGLDISGSRFLLKEQIPFLVANRDAIFDPQLMAHFKTSSDNNEQVARTIKKIRKWENKYGSSTEKRRISEFGRFSAENENASNASVKANGIDKHSGRSKAAQSLVKKWYRMNDEARKVYREQCVRCPDPAMSRHRHDVEFGVLPERIEHLINDHLATAAPGIKRSELRSLLSTKVVKTICPPGEPVGLLAAQSIGEPSTQMTLNTFHFAGRGEMNVTLGIPRLREILMTASKNIKTPSMEIPFREDLQNLAKQSKKLRLKLARCVLTDVLKNITINRVLEDKPHRRLVYDVTIEFLHRKCYKEKFLIRPREMIDQTENVFFKNLFREIRRQARSRGTMLHFEDKKRLKNDEDTALDEIDGDENKGEAGTRRDVGEMHESSDEEEAAEDADATAIRSISRHRENREYDDPEEEEMDEAMNDREEETADGDDASGRSKEQTNREEQDDDYDDGGDDLKRSSGEKKRDDKEQRKDDVMGTYKYALDYDYDENKFLWCKFSFWLPLETMNLDLATIIKKVASQTIVWETPCIKKGFIFQNPKGETILKTDGLNIAEMFKYVDILNINKLYSNDIHNICQIYGIEAANRVIIKEVKDVFKMYGITVDPRHLSLIADYMTYDGTFQPLSRKGMEASSSPFQQISFESSLNFLKNATLEAKKDDLLTPSSRLMVGQPCKSGTGAFSMLIDIQKQLSWSSSSSVFS